MPIDALVINPFISSTINVLTTMANVIPQRGEIGLKQDRKTWGDVTGIIGLAGYQATGHMLLSFDQPSILKIVNSMLGESYQEINDQVVDAAGELTNMISGGAKREFNELGFFFEMATPIVIVGKDVAVNQLTKDPIISVPFTLENGVFRLEASLVREEIEK